MATIACRIERITQGAQSIAIAQHDSKRDQQRSQHDRKSTERSGDTSSYKEWCHRPQRQQIQARCSDPAITSEIDVARKLQLVWGVTPLLIPQQKAPPGPSPWPWEKQEKGLLREGDLVIQTAGTLAGVSGSTDLVKVGIVSAVLAKGRIGNGTVSGRVRLALTRDSSKIEDGESL